MADNRRIATWGVPAVLAVGVVVAVLALGTAEDDAAAPDDEAAPAVPTATPSVRPDPETWCVQFRALSQANADFVATPGEETADALVETATDLLTLGQPLGLQDGGFASLEQLAIGAIASAGGPTDVATSGGVADPAQLDGYLATTCPA